MDLLHYADLGFALIAVLINGVFTLLILTRTSLTAVYVTFLLNCSAAMIWNFGDFMLVATANRFWFYFSLIGTGMVPAAMFHFVNALARPARNRAWIVVSYLLCAPFVLSSPVALVNAGVQSFVDGPFWNVLFLIVLSSAFTAGVLILGKRIKNSKSENEKSRLRYILVAACIAVGSGITDLLQIFHLPVPPLGHLGSVVYSSVLAVSVFKHRTEYDLLAEMRSKLDMLNELAAGIAHELKTPLSSIQGAARWLIDRSAGLSAEKSREYLNLICEEVVRLDQILTNYRSLVRPATIQKEPVDINRVLEKTVQLTQMNDGTPRIELSLSQELPVCESDPNTLRQVFINLIKNACEACGHEGALLISTEYIHPAVTITFTDTGGGVPPEILPRIFEPFVSTKESGMGLGLAICRRLVDLNGGTIEAANEQRGARFTIHLPVAKQSVTAAAG
jgi:signal transduction histidine kinase